MLEELRVRNYALIDELTVRFRPGFNVLSGETGAGKSILIDALSLALGGRGRTETIRQGAEEAEVTALLKVGDSPELREWIDKYGIEPEDGTLLIRRTLRSNGRGIAGVQAVPVTRTALGELAAALVDVHGQHEHQSLFNVAAHRKLLDRFAGLENRVDGFTGKFSEAAALAKRIDELDREEDRTAREADFLRFAVEEIDAADLKDGEEEELEERQKILARHEELAQDLERTLNAGSESRNGALALLRTARGALESAAEIDSSLDEAFRRLETAFFEIEDIVQEVRRRREAADFDPAELETIDGRLARIRTLQKKHAAATVSGLLEYAEKARSRLKEFDSRGSSRAELVGNREELQRQLVKEASEISRFRREASKSLRGKTEEHLKSLGMGDARFSVELQGKQSEKGKALIGPYGSDEIEFLLSANRGEPPKPLRSVASGGEISRVMLALKTVLSESDTVDTLIFDEVDSGIGGEVARSVGEHLRGLSENKQVFCITHLASIAVFADNHLQVDKETTQGRTVTRIRRVDGDARVREVARMLAGNRDDSASLGHASRLLDERGRK